MRSSGGTSRLRGRIESPTSPRVVAAPARPVVALQGPHLLDELAKLLERGRFHGLFIADVLGSPAVELSLNLSVVLRPCASGCRDDVGVRGSLRTATSRAAHAL